MTIISATEPTGNSPTERLVETVLAGFAQLDNDIRSERARNGMKARFESGMVVSGRVPLGYVMQGEYAVKDTDSWDKMKKAWDLMATGTKSLREIAKTMNDWGLREKNNGREYPLRRQRVNYLFRNKFYMGILASKTYMAEIKGQHVPMITEEQFYRVQAILDGRNLSKIAMGKRNNPNADFPLRRVVKCAKCGTGLTGAWSKGRNSRYAYYRCGGNCNTTSIKVNDVDSAVISLLKEVTPKKECLDLFLKLLTQNFNKRLSRLQKIRGKSDEEINRLKEVRRSLVEKNLAGTYSDEVFKEQNSIIEDKMVQAHILKDENMFDDYDINKLTTFIKTLLADLGEAYKRSNISQIKVLLGSIFPVGLAWNYNGTLNHQISPIYRDINAFTEGYVSQCGR